jgi:hypothetical protein
MNHDGDYVRVPTIHVCTANVSVIAQAITHVHAQGNVQAR